MTPTRKRPQYHVGDQVSFDFSIYRLNGFITEYRGRLGKDGGHLYAITFEFGEGDPKIIELGEEELELAEATPASH